MLNKDFSVAEKLLGVEPLPAGTELDAENVVIQKYLDTTLRGISEMSDDDWDKLPETVQEWFNDAAQIVGIASDKGEVAVIPVPEQLEVAKAKAKHKAKAKAKKKPKKKIKSEVKAVTEPEEPEEPKKEKIKSEVTVEGKIHEPKLRQAQNKKPKPKPKQKSNAQIIREMICENAEISFKELMNQLDDLDVHPAISSAKIVWLSTTKAFEAAHAEGGVMREGKDYLQAVDWEED